MTQGYEQILEKQNIVPIKLTSKDSYYLDILTNLQFNYTSRIDALFSNEFIKEAIQLIINSIVLFEKGYFDCAFYSLRQSLEISTVLAFFVDDDEPNRKKNLKRWKNEEWFPLHSQMIKELKARDNAFSDITNQMPEFFHKIDLIKKKANKYVHKQGFGKFHVSRNNVLFAGKFKQENLISDFEEALNTSIAATAIFRLVIDPMPILLMDEDIYNRMDDILTDQYTEEFVLKYIGQQNIDGFKKTHIYTDAYNEIIKWEKMNPSIVDVVKNSYIDRFKFDEISTQFHLLTKNDIICVFLTNASDKISTISCTGGFSHYFTNVKTIRTKLSWGNTELKEFDNANIPPFNKKYDEAFLSMILIAEEKYYIEHNEEFTVDEQTGLLGLGVILSEKFKNIQ